MDNLVSPPVLQVLLPYTVMLAVVGYFGARMYFKHQERLEKIRHGIDPDVKRQ